MGEDQPGMTQSSVPVSPGDRDGTGPIIVTALMAPRDQTWADNMRRLLYPTERNFVDAHISLFRHLPPSCLDELKQELRTITRNSAPAASIDRLLPLAQGVAYHVNSAGLLVLREGLADRFSGLLTPQDAVAPQLHITVQNKATPELARATLANLRAEFSPRRITIAGIALWYYRGGPWTPIATFKFRG